MYYGDTIYNYWRQKEPGLISGDGKDSEGCCTGGAASCDPARRSQDGDILCWRGLWNLFVVDAWVVFKDRCWCMGILSDAEPYTSCCRAGEWREPGTRNWRQIRGHTYFSSRHRRTAFGSDCVKTNGRFCKPMGPWQCRASVLLLCESEYGKRVLNGWCVWSSFFANSLSFKL